MLKAIFLKVGNLLIKYREPTTFSTNFLVLKISKCAKDIPKFFTSKQRANF